MQNKIIIIGAGLVGNILAWQLHFQGVDFLIYDEERETSSSRVAGGVYNPVVFKRFTLSWEAEKFINYLNDFYKKIEDKLNIKFHKKIDIYKILVNEDEVNLWKKKAQENSKFMDINIYQLNHQNIINENLAYAKVLESGYIDTNKFIDESIKYFKSQNKYINKKIEYSEINDIKNNNNKIVFAEGFQAEGNPYFPEVKFKLAKGEILDIKINNFEIDYIISKNLFMFPKGNNVFTIGATFEWDFADDKPTEKQKNILIENLKKFLKVDFEVIDQKAGIRPSSFDRRPYLGQSQIDQNIYIFNGMGAKAVMIAPYTSEIMYNSLINNTEIPREINISRCKS